VKRLSQRTRDFSILTRVITFLAWTSIFLCLTISANAQVDRTAITGTVSDASERVLPDVIVVVSDDASGFYRQVATSAKGTYDFPELPVGSYTLTFTRAGFETLRFENVVQTVSFTRTLNATLRVAGAKEQVDVSATEQPLDQTSNTLGTATEEKQIKELPLNGRNWATLTALAPAAIDTGGSNQRSIRFAGRGRDDNNFTYDGIDATNIINQAQQPYVSIRCWQPLRLEALPAARSLSALLLAQANSTGTCLSSSATIFLTRGSPSTI
jgi:hypothetical protein